MVTSALAIGIFSASKASRTALKSSGAVITSKLSSSSEKDITNIQRILDLLDEDDDVQEVYHNWEE